MQQNEHRNLPIAIIGAGPGGLCMAIRLKQAGFEDFVIFEKSSSVGGTWNHNRYPGCACDIQSHLYSFSFEFKPDWSRPYAPQPEILAYMEYCAEKYRISAHCRFDDGVRSASWDEEKASWNICLESGKRSKARILISAIGMFNEIVFPDIEGLDSFEGKRFHSSKWDWNYDLHGKTVGVVGSAASAVQLVPEIVKEASQVHLFQRTANWVLPKEDDPYSEEELANFRSQPHTALSIRQEIFERIETGTAFTDPEVRGQMESTVRAVMEQVEDPEVRAKLVPDHMWGCKRPLFSNDYYPAFNRPNLELVTDSIEQITPQSILTEDGVDRPIDALVLATGFSATRYLSSLEISGREGLRIADAWSDGAQAYLGVMTSGFPNLFMLYGPNTNQGSIITMIEAQVEHALQHIQRIEDEGLTWVDVKPKHMADYNVQIQKDIQAIEPWQDGCNGYYRSPSGRVVTQWPHNMTAFQKKLEVLKLDAYEALPREPASPA